MTSIKEKIEWQEQYIEWLYEELDTLKEASDSYLKISHLTTALTQALVGLEHIYRIRDYHTPMITNAELEFTTVNWKPHVVIDAYRLEED